MTQQKSIDLRNLRDNIDAALKIGKGSATVTFPEAAVKIRTDFPNSKRNYDFTYKGIVDAIK